MKNRKGKAGALFLGLGAALLCVEVFLRVFGFAYMASRESGEAAGSSPRTILCVGGSFTHGIGSTKGGDYPSRLQALLNDGLAGEPYRVVNRGVPANNLAMIVRNLPAQLEEFRPGLVLLSVSSAIYWNYWGYQDHRGGEGLPAWFNRLLYRTRTWKLAVLIARGMKGESRAPAAGAPVGAEEEKDGWQLRREQRLREAETWFNRALSRQPRHIRNHIGLGLTRLDRDRCPEAEASFRRALELKPGTGAAYWGLGLVYRQLRETGKSMEWFRKGVKASPDFGGNYWGIGNILRERGDYAGAVKWSKDGIKAHPTFALNYWNLGLAAREQGKLEEARGWFEAGIRADPQSRQNYMGIQMTYLNEAGMALGAGSPDLAAYGPLLQESAAFSPDAAEHLELIRRERRISEEIDRWVAADLERAAALCREKGISVVFVSNPRWRMDVFRDTAARLGVPYIDNFSVFSRMWEEGKPRADYLAPDGWHCNDRGYKVMAGTVFDALKAGDHLPGGLE
jgi:tetratricopeptide (TPR) repeat protein